MIIDAYFLRDGDKHPIDCGPINVIQKEYREDRLFVNSYEIDIDYLSVMYVYDSVCIIINLQDDVVFISESGYIDHRTAPCIWTSSGDARVVRGFAGMIETLPSV